MSLSDQIAALRAKASKGDKTAKAELEAFGIKLEADDGEGDDDKEKDAEADEDKDKDGSDDEEKDKQAEGDEDDDEDEEPKASATGAKAGFALMSSKDAKGREDLARRLANKVTDKKLTYGEAKGMLASAPKSSRLGAAMAGRDRNVGSDGNGAGKPGATLGAAVDRLNAKRAGKR